MSKYKKHIIAVTAVILLISARPGFSAETWRLDREGQLQAVSDADKYLLAVSEIKKLVNMGETEAVGEAIEKLKKDFPEIAGPDLDAFLEAEMLYCEGEFTKAGRAYKKFLSEHPQSELYEAVLDRQFAIATAYLGGQKRRVLGVFKMRGYAAGERLMDGISDRSGDSPMARKAVQAIAENYEKRGKYAEAFDRWSEISSRWPTGESGKKALLSMARCKYAAYRGPKYDSTNLISAKGYYERFKLRYPTDAEDIDVDGILKQIEEQLAYKQFSIGEYYQQTGNTQAGNLYYQMVVDNWPESTAAKIAKEKMTGNVGGEETKK
jgi:outer membrane protein assembly factor BamD (BamD/ComL family)